MSSDTNQPATADAILEIMLDADELGDKEAAAKNEISTRSLTRYRKQMFESPQLAARYFELKRQMFTQVIGRVCEVQRTILDRLQTLAAKEYDISKVAAAYRVVCETFMAQSLIASSQTKDAGKDLPKDGRLTHEGARDASARQQIRAAAEQNRPIRALDPPKSVQ